MSKGDLLDKLPVQPIPDGPPGKLELATVNATPLADTVPPADITPVDQAGPGGILQLMQQAIASKDKDMLLTLEGMHDRAHARLAKAAFLDAFALFQDACPLIPKLGIGRHTHKVAVADGSIVSRPTKYAKLPDLIATCEEHLNPQGLSLSFTSEVVDGKPYAVALLEGHGHEKRVLWPILENPPTKDSPRHEVYAAAARFAQRYAALSILGIPDDEIDPEDVNAPGGTVEPGPPISRDCIDTINDLLKQKGYRTDGERDKFFKWLTTKCRTPVTSTDTIPETQYDFCIDELNRMTDAT